MKLKATRDGTWPAWSHWAAGEVREIKVEDGVEIPSWLVEVKAKSKAPAKKAKKKADPEG